MMTAYDIIIRPVISEQSMSQMAEKKYTFEVALAANKIQIKKAVEEAFGVEVESVTTQRVLGKVKRMGAHFGKRPDWKKAVVKLTASSKDIEFFSSLV